MPIRRPSLVRATIRNRSRSAIAENGEETTALEDGQIKGGKIQHLDGRSGVEHLLYNVQAIPHRSRGSVPFSPYQAISRS
jgi:hypothetical protein